MKKQVVLVVGGAGFIGSFVNKMLNDKGYQTLVVDNLSKGCRESVKKGGFVQGDIADTNLLKDIFETYSIQAVIHFAAHTDVGESVRDPAKYYLNNVSYTLNLLRVMILYQVRSFIFSSTAAIYGIPRELSLSEEHPCNPINPYGESKWMVEKMLKDFDIAYGLKFFSLRYFNAAGGDPEGEIKNHQGQVSNLIPRILLSLKKEVNEVTIYGTDYPTIDGTCIRDYIHIADLANAHILAMEHLLAGAPSNYYNLGSGKGFSVREVIHTVEATLGKKIKVFERERRVGDPAILIADCKKALNQLNWQPHFSLREMIEHAWVSFSI